jgi:hypothetical protein
MKWVGFLINSHLVWLSIYVKRIKIAKGFCQSSSSWHENTYCAIARVSDVEKIVNFSNKEGLPMG